MKKRVKGIIALIIMIGSAFGILFYFYHGGEADRNFESMKPKDEFDLLELQKKNPDLIGWIKISDVIDYPVMKGEKYLHRNFDEEYSESGTPFVKDEWTADSENSLIYGHNMWVQRTVFNPLHGYEDKDFWEKHKEGVFYVIMQNESGSKYVDERKFSVVHTIKTSVKIDYDWGGKTNFNDKMDKTEYIEWCEGNEEYDTEMKPLMSDDLVTLCTCSYHISGDRNAGRLLVVGRVH